MTREINNTNVEKWLAIAAPLMRSLLPKSSGLEVFGHGMPSVDFAALVDREGPRVDHALVAMGSASGEAEVQAIVGQLSADTLIALFSRWGHYLGQWNEMLHDQEPQLWVPPKMDQVWRAVFLSMTSEGIHSTAAAQALWPEVFGALEE